MTVLGRDTNKDGRPDQAIYTLRGAGRSVFISVDSALKGQPDNFVWIYKMLKDDGKPEILHEESLRPEARERTWFGPGNRKLIGHQDLDHNGTLETTVYYNRTAVPDVASATVARFATDYDADGKPDVWFFPFKRMEMATTPGGPPTLVTENTKLIRDAFSLLLAGQKPSRSGLQALPAARSWILHPENIPDGRFRAMIAHEY